MLELALHFLPFTAYRFRGEERACPVCGCNEHTTVARFDRRLKRLSTVMCERCGLVHTNPAPDEEELGTYYQKFYRFDYQMTARPTRHHVRKRNAEAQKRIDHLAPFLKTSARSLDFGAGSGEFVEQMLAAGHDAHGLEPGENYASHAREKLGDRIQMTGYQDARFDMPFDVVTSFHVLEHLRAPLQAIGFMQDVLAPDGIAYIEVPNMGRGSTNKGYGNFHFAHLLGFNHYNLRLAAHNAGLKEKLTIRPTGILFEKGQDADPERLAASGLAEARQRFLTSGPARSYFSYQFGKAAGRLGLTAARS